nr:hypothetical protein [uncultured Desulfobulbus sp.]
MQAKGSDAACQGKLKLNYVSITMPDTPENYSEKLNARVLRAFENRKGWSGILIIDSFDKDMMQALASDAVEANMQ